MRGPERRDVPTSYAAKLADDTRHNQATR